MDNRNIRRNYLRNSINNQTLGTSNMSNSSRVTSSNALAGNGNNSCFGNLIVNVTSLRKLYPVKNALVTIFIGDINNKTIIDQKTTDENGKVKFTLSTPSKAMSEQPEMGVRPYASYNISTTADGYVEAINLGVTVFPGITSLQNVNLTLKSTLNGGTSPIIISENSPYPL